MITRNVLKAAIAAIALSAATLTVTDASAKWGKGWHNHHHGHHGWGGGYGWGGGWGGYPYGGYANDCYPVFKKKWIKGYGWKVKKVIVCN